MTVAYEKVFLSATPSALFLILKPGAIYTFDHSGRPIGLSINGRYYARSFDGRIKEKNWSNAADVLDRYIAEVPQEQSCALMQKLHDDVQGALAHVRAHRRVDFHPGAGFDDAGQILEKISGFLKNHIGPDVQAFKNIYRPVTILPPDQYFPIVIQLAEGCPWNQCTFCHFYKGRTYRLRSREETARHISDVASFLGPGLSLRRTIFLGDANALAAPTALLKDVLDDLMDYFPEQLKDGGVFTFGDVPSILKKTSEELGELRDRGLRRVYVGLETGLDPLRRLVKKPGSQEQALQAIAHLKTAGINAGLVVLLGLGEKIYEEAHVKKTVETLAHARLDQGDVVFFSPFYGNPAGFNKDDMRRQLEKFKTQLADQAAEATVGVYDVREFVY